MWYNEYGKDGDVVLSSRIRLARNVKGAPFPYRASKEQQHKIIETCKNAVIGEDSPYKDSVKYIDLNKMEPYQKQAIAELHLISPNMIDDSIERGILLSDDNKICIMVNEEDHMRIQCMSAGFDLDSCYNEADKLDDMIEEKIDYAFDKDFGYLTCCPTNVGTGLRASVMVHLPALVASGTFSKLANSLAQLGLAVRGIYGEGSKAIGNIFQISNQVTLGVNEEDTIEQFKQIIAEVIENERVLRDKLHKTQKYNLEDKLMRSYGILTNSVLMTSNEAMKRLSDIRFAKDLNVLDDSISYETLNELTYSVLPANIAKNYNLFDETERDLKRAEIIKEKLRS